MINKGRAIVLTVLSSLAMGTQSTYCAVATASGASPEKRVYEILIDDKHAGSYQLTFSPTADGGIRVDSEANVSYKVLIFGYNYSYKGHEIWNGDTLVALESDCNDNGKRVSVRAFSKPDGIHVAVNGKLSVIAGDTITSSYWHLPENFVPGAPRQYLEVDSGRVFKAKFKPLADQPVTVAGGAEICKHFQITGEDSSDVWFDGANRLVRQVSSDDGHRTTVVLRTCK